MAKRPKRIVVVAALAFIFFGDRSARAADASDFTDVGPAILSARLPDYSKETRAQNLTGWGIVQLEIDPRTGLVKRAFMERSTGEATLDKATLAAYRDWRFKPRTINHARLPVVFTGGGTGSMSYEFHEKPMEKLLARYLGDKVVKASLPFYPSFPPWTLKSGRGVYELHVRANGTVENVVILKRSGDETFDKITIRGLQKWRFRRGPLIVEIPLHFTLTPISYFVDIAR